MVKSIHHIQYLNLILIYSLTSFVKEKSSENFICKMMQFLISSYILKNHNNLSSWLYQKFCCVVNWNIVIKINYLIQYLNLILIYSLAFLIKERIRNISLVKWCNFKMTTISFNFFCKHLYEIYVIVLLVFTFPVISTLKWLRHSSRTKSGQGVKMFSKMRNWATLSLPLTSGSRALQFIRWQKFLLEWYFIKLECFSFIKSVFHKWGDHLKKIKVQLNYNVLKSVDNFFLNI